MDPRPNQAVFPLVTALFGRSRWPGWTTVDQGVSIRAPEARSLAQRARCQVQEGIGGPVVMHHACVTLGVRLGLGLGVLLVLGAGQAWGWVPPGTGGGLVRCGGEWVGWLTGLVACGVGLGGWCQDSLGGLTWGYVVFVEQSSHEVVIRQ